MGWPRVKVTVDTNILLRVAVQDDKQQALAASKLLQQANLIAVTLPCLCEFVWVLGRVYGFSRQEIATALTALLSVGNIAVDRPAVDAGFATLNAGGDFADGVIAHEGRWLGGKTFVSFDRKAVSLLVERGHSAQLLS